MLENKVILITGASSGIGKSAALLLAEKGADVIINCPESAEKEADELVGIITKKGQKASKIVADVSVESQVLAMFDKIREKYKKLDVLINNAGIMKSSLLLMTKVEEFDQIFNVNCRGVFLCMRATAKMMMKQKRGKIINLASIVGTHGDKGLVAYAASKSAVIGMTKSAAKELGVFNVTVNAVAPGLIDTNMTKDMKEEAKKDMVSKIALGHMGRPEDVAKVILFLSSELSDYVSGQIIGIDGCQII